ncbi:MAG: SnoaL-like domain-containing protein, partial [Maribacter sp.]|nr:SnoaL-like domain-containing protein [Maribacter sp.]
MKPTKKQEQAIMQVYEAYWAEYLNGNVEGMVPLLDASYTQVGSAESEVFSTKKEAVQFLVDTIDQVAGKLEMRNRSTKLEEKNQLILVHEICDLYALAEKKWTFYSKFRATTLLTEKKEGWKIIHQHSSFPDSKTEEGQNVAIDKIAEENRELREAVKRRTVELEQKNRELEIETALEKVRAKSMAMYKSEELADLSLELVKQVQNLGVATWFCAFNIYDGDPKGSIEWGSNGQGTFAKYRTPREGIFLRYYKAGQKGESLLINEIGEKECPAHYEYLCTLPGVGEQLLQMKEAGIPFPKSQIDHVAYFKYGYVLFITFEPAPEAHEIFKRFAKVFEQTYTRFLDLKKAEAQAREAQIEAALERVRSKSMAMHESSEMLEVIEVVSNQLKELKLNFDIVSFAKNKQEGDFTFWMTSKGQPKPILMEVPTMDSPVLKGVYKAKKTKTTFLADVFTIEENREWHEHLIKYSNLKYFPEPIKEYILNAPGFARSSFLLKNIDLYVGNYRAIPFTEEENSIFNRFAQVFEQAYTRFLDLQKAEAQVREAQIEAALERVRSKTMAMHNSNDVGDTVVTLFDEVLKLGLDKSIRIGIGILEGYKGMETWSVTSTPKGKVDLKTGMLNMTIHPMLTGLKKAWKSGKKSYSYDYIGDDVFRYYQALNNEPEYPFEADLDSLPENEYHKSFFFTEGILFSFAPNPISEEAANVLDRFAKVFGQTYRRYLDLQKAEAQVREAQIEAALEKVRSSSLAMHKSDEMQLVVDTIYEQLKGLGFEMHAVGMSGAMDAKKGYEVWAGGVGLKEPLIIPYSKKTKVQRDYNKVLIERTELFAKTYKGKIKKEYIDFLLTNNKFPTFLEKLMLESTAFSTTLATSKNSGMQILRYTDEPYTNQENTILIRFAKVFEQAYIRFMDLQKAEAQTRESQIETALERVRSQSMGMQTSKDLSNVTTEMFNQLRQFGGDLYATGVVFCDKHKNHVEQWHSLPDAGMISPFIVPIDLDYIHQYRYDQWKKGTELFSIEIPSDFIEQHFNDIFKLPSAQVVLKEFETNKTPMPSTPDWEIDYGASFKHGYLLVSSLQPFKEAEILPRFAKVFEQTYTRFLDLQKAEAQAREAQIELGLERVRARAMAMQHSDELSDLVATVFNELTKLDFALTWCIINIINEADQSNMVWATNPEGGTVPESYYMKFEDYPYHHAMMKAWKAQKSKFVYTLEGKEKKIYDDYLYNETEFKRFSNKAKKANRALDRYVASFTFCNFGGLQTVSSEPLSDENLDILERFGKVFDLTYTRFNDLQKAEAQAREAQIENALEKVRSRTMAMQKGEELKEVVVLLYKELIALGVDNFVTCGYVEINETTNRQETWVTNPGGDSLGLFHLPLTGDATFDERYAAWKKQQIIFHQKVAGEVRSKHLEYAITTFNSKEAEEMVLSQFPDPTVFYCFNFSHGYLHIVSASRLKEEEESLLARFTRVFEQTYARFLDLKKAEAQTREAQIENALEKVRSRTMAMQHSGELPEAANNLFLQVQALGIPAWSAGYCIWENDDKKMASCNMSSEGEIQNSFILPTIGEGYNFYDPLKKGETFYIEELGGDALVKHYEFMQTLPKVGEILQELINAGLSLPTFQIFHILYFPHGYLMFITYEQVPEAHDIFKRFAKVFEQTYTRFLDLQKAETQAREATKQASLDRVRGQIASMRTTADLNRITPLLWNELTTLGLPFIRCGVFIIDEPTQIVEAYLSAPDGHSLGAMKIPFNADKDTAKTVAHWKKKEVYRSHWDKKQFLEFMQTMTNLGQVQNQKEYQGADQPPESLYLHFVPFTQGMLYVGNVAPLATDQIESVQSLADAFALA